MPPTYKGKTHTITTPVEGNLLTLKVPGMCLKSCNPFTSQEGGQEGEGTKSQGASRLRMKVPRFFSLDRHQEDLEEEALQMVDHATGAHPRKEIHRQGTGSALVNKNGHTKRVVKTPRGFGFGSAESRI